MGDKYDIEEYAPKHMDNEIDMLMMPMDVVNGALVFFSIVANDLSKSTLTFLEEKAKELKTMVEELKQQE
jgi:hypothetical protein